MAENNLQQARQRVQQSRTQLESRLQESRKAREQLEQAKRKFPSRVSQMALRGGLEGRTRRRQIKGAEERIEVQQQKVRVVEKGLKEFERTQLKPAEAEIRRVSEFNRALKNVQMASDKGQLGAVAQFGEGIEQELAKELLKQQRISRSSQESKLKLIEKVNISGIESLSDFEKRRFEGALLKKEIKTIEQLPPETLTVLPSQKLTPIQADLKTINGSKRDVIDVSSRDSVGIFGNLRSRITGTVTSIIGDQKDFEKGREVFNKQTGLFETVSADPQLASGTRQVISTRLPTIKEAEKFKKLDSNILTIDTQELRSRIRDVKRLEVNVNKLSKDISKSDIKIKELEKEGVSINKIQEEQSKRNKLVEELNRDISRIEQKKDIQVGLIGGGRTRDIREFNIFGKPISGTSKVITATLGETAGIGTEKGLNILGFEPIVLEEEKIKVIEPQFGTQQISPLTGRVITGEKEITIPKRIITSEEIGKKVSKVTEVGADVGKFFIPVAGAGLFVGEVGEFGVGVSKSLKDSGIKGISKEQLIGGALLGGILLTGGAIRGTRLIKKPFTKIKTRQEIGLSKTGEVRVIEVQDDTGKFLIETVTRPQLLERETTRFREFFKLKPLKQKVIKEKTKITFTPLGSKADELIITATKTPRGKVSELTAITGKSKKVGEKLTPIEKEILKEIKEKRSKEFSQLKVDVVSGAKGTRAEVPSRLQPEVPGIIFERELGKEAEIFSGKIRTLEVGKFRVKDKGEFELSLFERRKTIKSEQDFKGKIVALVEGDKTAPNILLKDFKTVYTLEKKQNVIIRGEEFAQAKVDIGFRRLKLGTDIPTSKEATTISIRLLKKISDEDTSKLLQPSGVPKTPFSKTFQVEEVQRIVSQIKPPKKVITKPKTETIVITDELIGIPRSVGGSGLTEQQLARGRGSIGFFETQEVTRLPPMSLDGRTQTVLIPDTRTRTKTDLISDVKIETDVRQRDLVKERSLLDTKLDLRFEERFTQRDLTKQQGLTKQRDLVKERTTQKTLLRMLEKQIQRQTTVTTKPTKPKTSTPRVPIKPTTFLNLFRQIKKEDIRGDIDIKVRKGGKDIKIGEARTTQEAKEILKERLLTTLRASGFAERGGKKINLGFLGEGFRKSKTDPKRVVEIKQKRIKKAGVSAEAQEIQFFRKTKSSRSLFEF